MPVDPKTSPVACLDRHISESPFNVAPERKSDLLAITKNVTVIFDEKDDAFSVSVDPWREAITFGLAAAERLWAYCFAYLDLIELAAKVGPGKLIDLTAEKSFQNARHILSWAHDCERSGTQTAWPDYLPKPDSNAKPGDETHAATELFLCVCGWIILHEIGHIVCNHKSAKRNTKVECVKLEYEADDWASHWMLDKWKEHKDHINVYVKRTLGATVGLSVIESFEIYDRTKGGNTHPDPAERLLHFLDAFCPESPGSVATPGDTAWFAAVHIIQLHLDNVSKELDISEFANFRAYLVEEGKLLG